MSEGESMRIRQLETLMNGDWAARAELALREAKMNEAGWLRAVARAEAAEAKLAKWEELLKKNLTGPISQEIMSDPVVTSAGHTYERSNIEEWIRRSNTDPQTRATLTTPLIPNSLVKSMITDFHLTPNTGGRRKLTKKKKSRKSRKYKKSKAKKSK
jgi:hypothetical protein